MMVLAVYMYYVINSLFVRCNAAEDVQPLRNGVLLISGIFSILHRDISLFFKVG
jgi:hypothetical protein